MVDEWSNLYKIKDWAVTTPVDLYLIYEKSIWKNQVGRTGFLVYSQLDFYCLRSMQKSILKLIFAGQKSSLLNLIFTTWFFKNQVQINKGWRSIATFYYYSINHQSGLQRNTFSKLSCIFLIPKNVLQIMSFHLRYMMVS